MAESGVKSTSVGIKTTLDEVLGNSGGSTGRQAVTDLGTQLLGTTAMSVAFAAKADAEPTNARLDTLEEQAFTNAPVYPDTAAGLAATVEGAQFNVANADPDISYDTYRHDAGPVATLITTVPSPAALVARLATAANLGDVLDPAAARGNIGAASAEAVTAVAEKVPEVPRMVLVADDVAGLRDGDSVVTDADGGVVRLDALAQVTRTNDAVDALARDQGRWVLTVDPLLKAAGAAVTDAAGKVVSLSQPAVLGTPRYVLTADPALAGMGVVQTDTAGKVIQASPELPAYAARADAEVPPLSSELLAAAGIGLADEAAAWRADLELNGPPDEDPLNTPGGPVTVITDPAAINAYLPMVNRMDPVGTHTYRSGRLWRGYYGNNGPLGTNPEHTGYDMFMLIEMCDDDLTGTPPATDGATDDLNWHPVAIVHYAGDPNALVQDCQFFYTHQGYLVFSIAFKLGSALHTNRAWVIQNPDTGTPPDLDLETPGTFVIGPQTFFGYGFAFQSHYEGSEHRFFLSGFPDSSEPRNKDRIPRYCRLRLHETKVQGVVTEVRAHAEVISELPALLDRGIEDFPEPCAVPVGGDELWLIQRTDLGTYERRSYDGGKHWSDEAPSYAERELASASSKSTIARSPSGRLVWGFNNNNGRFDMSVMLSLKGSDGRDALWLPPLLLDGRARPKVTYPSIVFLRDRLGRYTGRFVVMYDRGRSETYVGQSGGTVAAGTPGSTTWNELITALVIEDLAAANAPDAFYRYTTNPGVALPA